MTDATNEATNVLPATITALAASTVVRWGRAASVERIVPVLYSLVITSTPKMAAAIWAGGAPVRLPPRMVSSGWMLVVTPTNTAMTGTIAAITNGVQAVARAVRTLVHSLRRAWAKPCRLGMAGTSGVWVSII